MNSFLLNDFCLSFSLCSLYPYFFGRPMFAKFLPICIHLCFFLLLKATTFNLLSRLSYSSSILLCSLWVLGITFHGFHSLLMRFCIRSWFVARLSRFTKIVGIRIIPHIFEGLKTYFYCIVQFSIPNLYFFHFYYLL